MRPQTAVCMKLRFRWAVITVLFLVALCVRSDAADAKPLFLWRVKSGNATAYLFGSIHVAKPQMYPLDAQIEQAFSNSDTLVVEMNVAADKTPALAMQMLAKSTYPPGDSLDKHVSKEVFAMATKRMAKDGLPVAQMKLFKPWLLAMTFTMVQLSKLGIDPQSGIDFHFLNNARGKRIVELESAEEQMNLFDTFSDKEQEGFLKYTLEDNDTVAQHIDDMITAWNNGDVVKIQDFVQKAVKDSPDLQPVFVKLFDDRNKRMAAKIEELLKNNNTYFIVVGAGHLVGKTGLLQLLGKNHAIEQMGATAARFPR
jgi:uncharacterized protein YbaP (TraB family)